jgi:TetR/AcrR family transcriptional repressor of nem operon
MVDTRRSNDSAERLLDAAGRLMHVHGYHGVGVAELCKAADVRPGSFYYHFPSKEDLAAAMILESWEAIRDKLFGEAFGDAAEDPFAGFDRYGELLEQNLQRMRSQHGVVVGCRFGNFAAETSPHHPIVAAATRQVFDAMSAVFTAVIEDGQHHGSIDPTADAALLAQLVMAQMEGLMVLAKAHDDPSKIRLIGEAVRHLIPSTTGDGAHPGSR